MAKRAKARYTLPAGRLLLGDRHVATAEKAFEKFKSVAFSWFEEDDTVDAGVVREAVLGEAI